MRLDDERLRDILEAIEAIERHVNLDDPLARSSFDDNELIRVWCLRHLEVIGEAAAKVSDPVRAKARRFPGEA